jgi:heme A synthase
VTPQSPGVATAIEFTHRVMTGIDLPLVVGLVWWAWRAFPRGHAVRLGAALSGVFLLTEALIGAALVKLDHVASNASSARGWSLSTHLINTMTLLACLALTAWWSTGKPRIRVRGREGWLAVVSLAAVLVLGITGAIAALGDTLFPAASLAEGLAQDWDSSSNLFVRLRGLHPVLAAGVAVWLVIYAIGGAARAPEIRRLAWIVTGLVAVQTAAGIVNLLLLAPVWMQILHLLLADLVWISLVLLCAERVTSKV